MIRRLSKIAFYLGYGSGSSSGGGTRGLPGRDGITPHIGSNGHWFIGNTDTGVVALDIPLDINGTIHRCKKQQSSLSKLTNIDIDLKILSACIKAKAENINITTEHFPWAEKCQSVKKSSF